MPTGVILQGYEPVWFALPELGSSSPNGIAAHATRGLYEPGTSIVAGSYVDNRPTAVAGAVNVGGAIVPGFKEDFYNRIYVIPTTIDLGAVSGAVVRGVTIWNAHLRYNANLVGVTVGNASGTYLSSGATTNVFKPLRLETYAITANADGPPTIDALYSFNFSVNSVYSSYGVTVTGNRAKSLPFQPNWSAGYKINYDYATEIITSRSGREQRIAQRITPRKSIEFKIMATGGEATRFRQILQSWQHRPFVLPEVTRRIDTTAPVLAGATSIVIPAAVEWIRPKQPVLVGVNQDINEVVSVTPTGVGTTQTVVLKTAVTFAYPDGLSIWYAVSGYFQAAQNVQMHTSATLEASIKFGVTVASEDYLSPGEAPTMFNGREVFTKTPNWSSPIDSVFNRNVEELDYARGITTRFNPQVFGTETKQLTFLARTSEEADEARRFYDRQRGRQGEFYMSTGLPDIVLQSATVQASYGLRIAGREFFDTYTDSTVFKAVCIRLVTGETIYNKVLSVDLVVGDTGFDSLITCEEMFFVNIEPENVIMISWMPVCRLGSDSMTIEYLTRTVAQFQLSIQTLEDWPV